MHSRIVTDGGYYQWAADDAGTTIRDVILAGDIDGNSTSQVRLYYQGAEKLRTKSDGITVTGTVYSTEGNSSQWDQAYDNHITNVSFNTSNGVLTLTQRDGGTLTQDLDGRYLTAATNNYVSAASFNIGTETLTLTRQGLGDLTTSFAGYLKDGEANNYVHPNDGGGNQTALTGATVYSDVSINTLGHVTGTTTRTLTLANLGYTGATNANAYVHPSATGDDINIDTGALTGATVISDLDFNITTNTLGHVTDANGTVATRNLTLGNLGYTGDPDATNTAAPAITTNGTAPSLASGITALEVRNLIGAGTSSTTGTVTSVSGGNGLTGSVTTSGSLAVGAGTGISVAANTVGLATAGAGAGTYGSTANGTKIDQITLDAYGRVTAISTGATGSGNGDGDITGVTAGLGLYGGGTSGSVTLNQYSSVTAGGTTSLADGAFRTVTAGAIQLSLPASPAAGDTVYISNGPYTNTTIARNGQNIMGLAENLTLDVENIGITLVFADSTRGWRIM
jgi:hypothetical protein